MFKLEISSVDQVMESGTIYINVRLKLNVLGARFGTYDSTCMFLDCSIGSLGEDGSENHVSDILVKNVMLTGTTNGVRIKTWQVRRVPNSKPIYITQS